MKPVVTRLYGVLVALTFVGLFAWAGADWYQLQSKAELDGRAALRQSAGWISDLTIRHVPLDKSTLGPALAALTGDLRWKMILLSSDRGTEFYRGPRPEVPVDQAPPRWDPHPWTEVKVAIPVFRADGDPLILEGIQEFYGPHEIFSLLKAVGFTLVVLLVVTTVMVLVGARTGDDPAAQDPEGPQPSEVPDPGFETPSFSLEGEPEETVGTIPIEDDEYWFDETLGLEDLPPLDPPTEGADLGSLHLATEAELAPRLEEELRKAGDQHLDVALVVFTAKDGADLGVWGPSVRTSFPQGLTFEYQGGAAVVLVGTTLEEALASARDFVSAQDQRTPGVALHAGVAARSGRSLPATVLLTEATSARRRSLAGSIRVLGLKTNADRYRESLKSASA